MHTMPDTTPCTNCHKPIDDQHTLCPSCEVRFALTLLRLAASLEPLHDMLDSTIHYGGHEPTRTLTSTPPTPIRLAVLDLIDDITTYSYELRRLLLGMPDQEHEATYEDAIGTLIADAGAPTISTNTCAGMYMRDAIRLMQTADRLLDPPNMRDIGHCPNPLCGVMLQACDGQQSVTCSMCGTTTDTHTIQLRTLERLCWDDERHGSAAQIARVFTDCGIPVLANTIRQWAKRGKLHATTNTRQHRPTYRYSDVYRLTVGVKRD